MNGVSDKFTPDKKVKSSGIGKIIATAIFVILGALLIYLIYDKFHKLLVPFFIVLGIGFILMSIWVKGLYIYRYMLPAILIILIFTVYPIFYTVYIAFTNYGTGHLMTLDDARTEVLTGKWDVDESVLPLYAEFYAPKDKIDSFISTWTAKKNDVIENVKKIKSDFIKKNSKNADIPDDDIEVVAAEKNRWYDEVEPGIIKSLDKIKKDEFLAIVFTKDKVVVDADGKIIEKTETNNGDIEYTESASDSTDLASDAVVETANEVEPVKTMIYLAKYDNEKNSYVLKEIALDEVKKYVGDMVRISDKVLYTEEELSASENEESAYDTDTDEFYNTNYTITFGDFADFENGLKEKCPIELNGGSYLKGVGNEFMKKKRSFALKDGKMYKLTMINETESDYTTEVYEDKKAGKFATTVDGSPLKHWNEYKLDGMNFVYGTFDIAANSEAESFLNDKIASEGLNEKVVIEGIENVIDKDITTVNAGDLNAVKEKIVKANKYIGEFNSKLGKFKKEYITAKKEENKGLNAEQVQIVKDKKVQIVELNKRLALVKREPAGYNRYMDIKDLNNQIVQLKNENKQTLKEIKARNLMLDNFKMPKLSKFKIKVIDVSNTDFENPIEPGFFAHVGFHNFTKIFTSKTLTAPFMRVFVWTVIWSAVSVITSFAMGLMLALVFNAGDLKGKFLYRTLFILPYAIPSFVSVLMWGGFLNDDFGVVNLALKLDIPWLLDPSGIMPKISCLLVNLWLGFPYMMIISLGALQSIDSSMYEAADVDGASKFQQFRLITLPLLLITLGPMLVGSFAFAFNNFGGIYLLTMGRPVMDAGVLPGHTDILISFTYKLAFGENETDYGLASAIAIIVFFIIGTITFLQFKFTNTFKEVDNA